MEPESLEILNQVLDLGLKTHVTYLGNSPYARLFSNDVSITKLQENFPAAFVEGQYIFVPLKPPLKYFFRNPCLGGTGIDLFIPKDLLLAIEKHRLLKDIALCCEYLFKDWGDTHADYPDHRFRYVHSGLDSDVRLLTGIMDSIVRYLNENQ